MKRIALATMVLLLTATGAFAQYSGGVWTQQWDFNSGPQGWNVVSGGGFWVDPAVYPSGPLLPDGNVSGFVSGGSWYLPDGTQIRYDVSSYNLGNTLAGRNGFIFQADAYIPNLRPLTGFTWGYPGNGPHQAGMGVMRSDGKGPFFEGKNDQGRWWARDYSWDNTNLYSTSWIWEEVIPDAQWWDKVVTYQLDYSYTIPGKWFAWIYVPWDTPMGPAGWWTVAAGRDCHPGDQFVTLALGGQYSWTQAEFDNAKLLVTPEPGTMLALGAGLVGLAGMIRRRK